MDLFEQTSLPETWYTLCRKNQHEIQFGNRANFTANKEILDFSSPFRSYKEEKEDGFTALPLFMCVLNQRSGHPIFYHEFPLYELYSVWLDFQLHVSSVSPERIVILHTQGKSILGFRNATQVMTSLGSLFVENLVPNSTWTWIFTSGGKTLLEKYVINYESNGERSTSSNVLIPLSNVGSVKAGSRTERDRWEFCSNNGVMGDLCDETSPAHLWNDHLRLAGNPTLKNIPVIITGGSRTGYLYQSLKSYFKSEGVVKDNFEVILGSHSASTINLLNLLNIKYTYIPPSRYGQTEFWSYFYYREVYKHVLTHYRNSTYAIFLEEDVQVAPDFFSYIGQTIHLLKKDPTLYCIAAYSSAGLRTVARDESVLLRASVQVGWGYAVTLAYVREAVSKWLDEILVSDSLPYDGWMYKFVKGDRECVVPEVSRTFHFGIGINTNYYLTERSFYSMPFANSTELQTFRNVERLQLSLWTRDFRKKLSEAIPTAENPCRKTSLQTVTPGSYVMFYNYSTADATTHFNYVLIASCFGGWTFSEQGQHDSVAKFKVSIATTFYLVGVPQSSFSDLRPDSYAVIDIRRVSVRDRNAYIERYNYEQNLGSLEFKTTWSSVNLTHLFS